MGKQRHSIREFESLRAVVEAGTTIGAARRLGVSQSAVSRALSQLEDRLGQALFVRDAGRIEPTAEALNLNETLDPLFETLGRIDEKDWALTERKPLRLAVPSTLAHHFVMPRLTSFLRQDERRRVHLDIRTTEQILAGILERRVDLGFTSAIIRRSGVKLIPWRRSKVVCAMPEDHPLAKREVVCAADLEGNSLIALVRRFESRALVDQILAQSRVGPRIVVEIATSMGAIDLVRQGLGVTLVNPFPVLTAGLAGVAVRPFETPFEYTTSFVLPADGTPAAHARSFMRHIKLTTPNDALSEAIT